MNAMNYAPKLLLMIICLICIYTDIKSRKIYNKVLLLGIIFGITFNIFNGGFTGIIDSLIGFVIGLGLLIIPFLLGGIGAGDVKLLAVVGLIMGRTFVLYSFLAMALIGLPLSIWPLINKGELKSTLKALYKGFWVYFASKGRVKAFYSVSKGLKVPYGVAVSLGAISTLFILG